MSGGSCAASTPAPASCSANRTRLRQTAPQIERRQRRTCKISLVETWALNGFWKQYLGFTKPRSTKNSCKNFLSVTATSEINTVVHVIACFYIRIGLKLFVLSFGRAASLVGRLTRMDPKVHDFTPLIMKLPSTNSSRLCKIGTRLITHIDTFVCLFTQFWMNFHWILTYSYPYRCDAELAIKKCSAEKTTGMRIGSSQLFS